MRYNEFQDRVFGDGELIILPKSTNCRGKEFTSCDYLLHSYAAPVKLCDRVGLNVAVSNNSSMKCEFESLPINNFLLDYLLLLKHYIAEEFRCRYFHKIKQK